MGETSAQANNAAIRFKGKASHEMKKIGIPKKSKVAPSWKPSKAMRAAHKRGLVSDKALHKAVGKGMQHDIAMAKDISGG